MTENIILISVIAVIIGLAVFYVCKEKKNGRKCIGCPDSKSCPHKKNGCGCFNVSENRKTK